MLTADEQTHRAGGRSPGADVGPGPQAGARDGGPAGPAYRIERTLRVTHSLDYRYKQPVRDVTTRLRLLPPETRGAQRLRSASFHAAPLPAVSHRHTDDFGNPMLEVRHPKVWEHLTFVVVREGEAGAASPAAGPGRPAALPAGDGLPPGGRRRFPRPRAAHHARRRSRGGRPERPPRPPPDDPASLAFALCRRVYARMRYAPGVTTVHTAAAEAWAGGKGVCQDYTHVLLVLCRVAGLPARYVSGFLPGEGAMHAWVEVLLPAATGDNPLGAPDHVWAALDPTHDRWVNEPLRGRGSGARLRRHRPPPARSWAAAPGRSRTGARCWWKRRCGRI